LNPRSGMDSQVDAFLQELDADLKKSAAPAASEAISAYPPAGAPPEEPKKERKRRRFEAAPPPVGQVLGMMPGLVGAAQPQSAVQLAAQAAAAAVLAAQNGGGVVGEFATEIEINDCPNRVMLTRGEVHREINEKTGAAVLCRGEYAAEGVEPPEGGRKLHLKITAPSQEKLDDAVELIKIKMELGAISVVAKLPPIIEDKVMIDLPMGLQRHQLVGKLLGPKGGNMRFVEQDTGCRIKLIGREVHEQELPLHFLLMCDSAGGINAAKELLTNLIGTVMQDVMRHVKPQGFGMPMPFAGVAPMPPGPPPGAAGYDPNAAAYASPYGAPAGYPPYDPNAAAYGAPAGYPPYDPNAAAYGAPAGYPPYDPNAAAYGAPAGYPPYDPNAAAYGAPAGAPPAGAPPAGAPPGEAPPGT